MILCGFFSAQLNLNLCTNLLKVCLCISWHGTASHLVVADLFFLPFFFPFFGSASLMNHSFLNLLHDIHEYATSFMLVVCWCMLRARVDSSIDQVAFESCIRYIASKNMKALFGGSPMGNAKKKRNHCPFTAGPSYESRDS